MPATVCIRGNTKSMVEINFLCVHKKLRSKRLTPLLIKVSTSNPASAGDTDMNTNTDTDADTYMSHALARR